MNEEFPEVFANEMALTDWSDDDDFLGMEMENDITSMLPEEMDKRETYLQVLKGILPHLGADEAKIILTEIMIALKLEGQIGKELSARETRMINTLKDAIMSQPIRRRQAITLAQRLLAATSEDQSEPA